MHDYTRKLEIVNGALQARRRGHGHVKRFLEFKGEARSNLYRWEPELKWLLEEGHSELRRLRRALDDREAALRRLGEEKSCADLKDPKRERAFVLTAAVEGNSDTQVANLLAIGGGRKLSHQTIHRILKEAGAQARGAFQRHFAGVGRVAAFDEIYLGDDPLLLAIEVVSLLISGLRLAEGRSAEDWKPVFALMRELERGAADGAKGLAKAARDRKVPMQPDMFHLLRHARACLGRYQEKCEKKVEADLHAKEALEATRAKDDEADTAAAEELYKSASEACDAELGEWCRLADLFRRVKRAFDYTTPDGKLNTAPRAHRIVIESLKQMKQTEKGRLLAVELSGVRDPLVFGHLAYMEAGLSGLRLEQVGPDRDRTLARLVGETLAWDRTDKTPVAALAQASNGTLADRVELKVIQVLKIAVRASSAVECVNARVRPVQVARKRLGEDFIYLLAVYHNMKPFGRGSVRAGRTPAELADIKLPTDDWIELLDLSAEPAQAGLSACDAQPGLIGKEGRDRATEAA